MRFEEEKGKNRRGKQPKPASPRTLEVGGKGGRKRVFLQNRNRFSRPGKMLAGKAQKKGKGLPSLGGGRGVDR